MRKDDDGMARVNIYKNLWAGYDCYFVRMSSNGRVDTGISVHNAYGDWRVKYMSQFYSHDIKNTEHFPIVGKIDIDQSIISAVLAAEEEGERRADDAKQ